MLGTYSFKCHTCGHYHDAFVKRGTRPHCPDCNGETKQVIRYAPKLDYLGMGAQKNAGPEFIDRFEKMHKDRKAHEDRKDRDHGDYGTMAGA